MKKTTILLCVILSFALLSFACLGDSSSEGNVTDEIQQEQTAAIAAEAHAQTGMPAITNFQERKLVKMLYELRDQEDLLCYCYIVNLRGEFIFVGECIGYGVPASVQFSNPERVWFENQYSGTSGSYNDIGGTIPQPEPNGLFMPEGLAATYVMLVGPDGSAHAVYMEPEIVISPFPLTHLTTTI